MDDTVLDLDKLPEHVAIIMDGNGRWAEKRKLPKFAGHNAGMKAMTEIVRASSNLGIKHLSVYAFSTENWKRSKEEVHGIFKLLVIYVEKELMELCKENVRLTVMGDYQKLPGLALASLRKALDSTGNNTGLNFNIALNYGSRNEIFMAAKKFAEDVLRGELDLDTSTEKDFRDRFYDNKIPDPDLVIRTSGEERLSNFMLWQSAYSELVFSDVLWPDFTVHEYKKALKEYDNRHRRVGGR